MEVFWYFNNLIVGSGSRLPQHHVTSLLSSCGHHRKKPAREVLTSALGWDHHALQ